MEKVRLSLPSRESSRGICLQVLPPHLLAGLAMLGAGMLLDHVQVSEESLLRLLFVKLSIKTANKVFRSP